MPEISVIICTYRRIPQLKKTLAGILQLQRPQQDYEVIVVDNAGEVEVKKLVEEYSTRIPGLTYCYEPQLGLDNARNHGVDRAKGKWVVFLDDDAIPEKHWLRNLSEFFRKFPDALVVGGRVEPDWPSPLPDWLIEDLFPYLSICTYDAGNEFFTLDFPVQFPVGANIAYHKDALIHFGGFNPRLDRYGEILLSGGETALNLIIRNAGHSIWFCVNAVVTHCIGMERITKKFFRDRFYWGGRSLALVDYEIYGRKYLITELFRRIFPGMGKSVPGFIYFGLFVRRSPLLAELFVRECLGYLIQGMICLFSQKYISTYE